MTDSVAERAKEFERKLRALCNEMNFDIAGCAFDNAKNITFTAFVAAGIENSPLRTEREHAELQVFMTGRMATAARFLTEDLHKALMGNFNMKRPAPVVVPTQATPKLIT